MSAPTIINGQVREGTPLPGDLLPTIGVESYRTAYREGKNLSVWLEERMPSEEYQDNLDAFSRMLRVAGVAVRSRPGIGVWASRLNDLHEHSDGARMLVPELFARMWRRAASGEDVSTRALYSSTDDVPGGAMMPRAMATGARVPRRQPPIRLAELVAITTPVDQPVYQAYYLTTNVTESRMKRVPEGTPIPLAKLTGADQTIKLLKYGRGIQASYEALRRMRLDKIQLWIEQLAIQNEMDKVSQAIYTLVNGDGNGNGATNWRAKTDLDAAATGKTVTLKAWLAFKLKFFPSYQLTHVVSAEGDMLKLLLLPIGSSTAMPLVTMPTAQLGGLSPMSNAFAGDTRYGVTPDVPADKLVGLDATAALEHVIEIGANIEEVERHARNQTQDVLMTEVEGFAVFDANATKTLELET